MGVNETVVVLLSERVFVGVCVGNTEGLETQVGVRVTLGVMLGNLICVGMMLAFADSVLIHVGVKEEKVVLV